MGAARLAPAKAGIAALIAEYGGVVIQIGRTKWRTACKQSPSSRLKLFAYGLQEVAGGVGLAFVHVGQDLEEQQELVECLLAFFLHFLLADDAISCLLPGEAPVLLHRRVTPPSVLHGTSCRLLFPLNAGVSPPLHLVHAPGSSISCLACNDNGYSSHATDQPCNITAGGLRFAAAPACIAEFKYVEQPEEAAAIRRIAFAPGLGFNALVTSILEGEGVTEEEVVEDEEPGSARVRQPAERQELSRPKASAEQGAVMSIADHSGR